MKILMLTPYLPYPLYSGGQIRTYNLLKNLANKHEITLFSFIREDKEKEFLPELKKFCPKVVVFKRRPAWDIQNILLAGFSPLPFVMISTYLSLTAKRVITDELKTYSYDLIHAEPFYMMPNIPKTNIPTLLVEQTIEYLVYKKFVDDYKFRLLKPLMYLDVMKLKFWEDYYWHKAAGLVAMSKEDREIMTKVVPQKDIEVVANGVDVEFFSRTKIVPPKTPTILFVGNFKWLPNKDAAQFLTYKIWPKIKQKIPQAKLWIVGKNPTKEISALQKQKDVIVQGDVEDIREAFGQASVLLAPIRNGRGTKYKVLEAMASQLPVVATPLGIEGTGAKNKREVLMANSAQDLAQQVIYLINHQEKARQMAQAALKLIKMHYDWKLIALNLDKIYKKVSQKN